MGGMKKGRKRRERVTAREREGSSFQRVLVLERAGRRVFDRRAVI